VVPEERTPRRVERDFRALLASGGRLRPAGAARRDPACLLRGYTPKHEIRLFGAVYWLTQLREDQNFRFFVGYVRLVAEAPPTLYPRLFYKDSSLVWRCATHYNDSPSDNWIGKGDLKWVVENGDEVLYSAEETTNLPLEIQCALDTVSRKAGGVRRDLRALGLVLRRAPDGRVAPYPDFSEPRRRARARRGGRIHGGEPVAWFTRPRDPESLRFAPGFEPDFSEGILEVGESKSRLYGGEVRKFRILSRNRLIQYQFLSAPRHVWIIPPQPLTTELSSYGVRTLDVETAEDLCVPGYEYHYVDEDELPPRLYSQIPEGFAGAASDVDPARADASPWLDRLPVIREFRRKVLGTLLAALALFGAQGAAALDARLAQVYAATCATCHTRPETRAPLTGDAEAWREATSRGADSMLARSVLGYRGMPPLGTCGFCSESDLRALIAFMTAAPAAGESEPRP
jgi:cytochrome c5